MLEDSHYLIFKIIIQLYRGINTQINGTEWSPKTQTHSKQPIDFCIKVQRQFMEERWSFHKIMLAQLDIHMQNNPASKPHILYKNQPKIDHRSKCKAIQL